MIQNKFSLQEKLNGLLHFQGYKENPKRYLFLGVGGHIGVDISRGDGDPIPAYYDGTVIYVDFATIAYITEPDENGLALEISQSHGKDLKVKVGDKIEIGDVICYQDSTGPSIMWKDDDPAKVAWSHEHLNIREIKVGAYNGEDNRWNFAAFSPIKYSYVKSDYTMAHFQDPNLYSARVLELIAEQGIKRMEGAKPARMNPGNLRVSPYTQAMGALGPLGSIASFPDYETGKQALFQLITDACNGELRSYKKVGMTVLDFFSAYAPSSDGNNPIQYAKNVVEWCGLRSINDPASDWLLTELSYIKKYNSVPFYIDDIPATPVNRYSFEQLLYAFRRFWNTFSRGK